MFCCLLAEPASGAMGSVGAVEAIARACSPRVAPRGHEAVVFDVEGLTRVWGPPEVLAREVARMAKEHGLAARVAVADTMTAAWVLAHAHPGITVACGSAMRIALGELPPSCLAAVCDLDRVPPHGLCEPAAGAHANSEPRRRSSQGSRRSARPHHVRTAPLPAQMTGYASSPAASITPPAELRRSSAAEARRQRALCQERLATLDRWGIRTCAALAALSRADLHARLGPMGVRLHQAAQGEDVVPLVPVADPVVFADRVVLEWPIDGLDPLAFVLARQCERLSTALERADRGAVALHTTLTLVTRETHRRHLVLPAPLRDARVLRTLIMLDLESHPPIAAIDVVELQLDATPGRILQGSLLTWAVPTPEDLSTLVARLGALVGETRVGAPICLDTHDMRQVALMPFRIPDTEQQGRPGASTDQGSRYPIEAPPLRRFRLPVSARVVVEHGTPASVWPSARALPGGRVVQCAGPWRSSGSWWTDDRATWDRDTWDVELVEAVLYRLARVRATGRWEIEGVFD